MGRPKRLARDRAARYVLEPMFVSVDPTQLEETLRAQADGLVLVYFWGPNCPNCDVFKAELPQLLPLLPSPQEGLTLVSVNAYEHTATATRYGLFGIPAFLFFHQGKLLGRMSEYRGKDFFAQVVREQLQRVQ